MQISTLTVWGAGTHPFEEADSMEGESDPSRLSHAFYSALEKGV